MQGYEAQELDRQIRSRAREMYLNHMRAQSIVVLDWDSLSLLVKRLWLDRAECEILGKR